MIKLGEAGSDERGALAYGNPGDQTQREVRIQELYNNPNRPWQKVFRAKKDEVRKKLALAMTQACNNDNIGYAQYGDPSSVFNGRYGLDEALKQTPSHTIPDVTIPCNVDCSALVAQCCRAAGIDVRIDMRTAQQVQILNATGAFDELPFSMDMKFIEGDILWLNGHTAIIVSVSNEPNKEPKWVGKITKSTQVRTQASDSAPQLSSWPNLGKDNLIDVCDEDGSWYYVRIAGKYFGYVKKDVVTTPEAPKPQPTPEPAKQYSKEPKWVGSVTQPCVVKEKPDMNSAQLKDWPQLGKTNLVDVCDEDGNFWYIRIAGKYFGFIPKSCLSNPPKPEPKPEPQPAPTPTPQPTPQPQPVEPTFEIFVGKVTTGLNVRTSAVNLGILNYCNFTRRGESKKRHVLAKDEKVLVIGEKGNWYQIKIVGDTNEWTPWVSKQYIQKADFEVGDNIRFIGNVLYTSSYSAGKSVKVPAFDGKIKNSILGAHPYSVISNNKYYSGWCDKKDLVL